MAALQRRLSWLRSLTKQQDTVGLLHHMLLAVHPDSVYASCGTAVYFHPDDLSGHPAMRLAAAMQCNQAAARALKVLRQGTVLSVQRHPTVL